MSYNNFNNSQGNYMNKQYQQKRNGYEQQQPSFQTPNTVVPFKPSTSFEGFESQQPLNNQDNYKIPNIPISSGGMKLSAKPFTFQGTPKPMPPADPVGDNMKKCGITEEEEMKEFKTLLEDLKAFKDKPISMDIFKKFADIKVCKT